MESLIKDLALVSSVDLFQQVLFNELTSILGYLAMTTEIIKPNNLLYKLESIIPKNWIQVISGNENKFDSKFKKLQWYFDTKFKELSDPKSLILNSKIF